VRPVRPVRLMHRKRNKFFADVVTMTTMMIKEETMAGAEQADVRNATLEDYRFLETHLPVQEAY